MEKLFEGLLIALVAVVIIGIIALFGGTIVYFIWPVAIQAFPGLTNAGFLTANLTWGQAVCLTWLFGILIKSTQTNNNSK